MKKLAVSLTAAALFLTLCGCQNANTDSSSEEDSKPAEVTTRPDDSGSVKLKNYSTPDFLESLPPADVLADVTERSFDPASLLTEPEKQPFEGYKCTGLFNDLCYVFKDDGGYGLLSLDGEVLLEPDGISKITPAGTSLLAVRYDDGGRDYYRADSEGIYKTDIGSFDKNRISFDRVEPDIGESGGNAHYIVTVDEIQVCDKTWLSWKETSCSALDTDQRYEAVYYAENTDGGYYLAFDSLYNLTICRAERGYAEMRIDDKYGAFYITDPEDLADLQTLINSFGDDAAEGTPKGDSSADYIRVVIGKQNDDDKSIYTISPDGYCLTELYRSESSIVGGSRYFRKLSSDTFADLVAWANMTFGTEDAE